MWTTWDAKGRLDSETSVLGTFDFTYVGTSSRLSVLDYPTGQQAHFEYDGGLDDDLRLSKILNEEPTNTVLSQFDYVRRDDGRISEWTRSATSDTLDIDYDPWGRMSLLNGTALPDFGYAGYYLHAPTGLNLAVFRAYDPELGQWLSREPIGERGGIRLHGYVGGDPVNASDPSGLFFETAWDVGNVILDLNSIQSNISEGN